MDAAPAATIVVLRLRPLQRGKQHAPLTPQGTGEGEGDFEALLLRRDSELAFHGGDWVFPGGRVDDEDREEQRDELAAARHAGAREVEEEAGLHVEPAALIPLSHWTTPDGLSRKFSTWFFITQLPPSDSAGGANAEVRIDDSEIREHRWQAPSAALADQRRGKIALPGPTFVTLSWLTEFESLHSALEKFRGTEPPLLLPRPILCPGGRVSLLPGDAGYDSCNLDVAGPRHRTWFLDSGWRYERRG